MDELSYAQRRRQELFRQGRCYSHSDQSLLPGKKWCAKCKSKSTSPARRVSWTSQKRRVSARIYNKTPQRRQYRRNYEKERCARDPVYKLARILRIRVCRVLSGVLKSGSAVRDLGCTVTELRTYLEARFKPGMTWGNHGPRGWHIDHVRPLASFDLTQRDQLLQACHYTNLQPLWWSENLTKGSSHV